MKIFLYVQLKMWFLLDRRVWKYPQCEQPHIRTVYPFYFQFWLTTFYYRCFFCFYTAAKFSTDFYRSKKAKHFLHLLIALQKQTKLYCCIIKEDHRGNRQFQYYLCLKFCVSLKKLFSYLNIVLKKPIGNEDILWNVPIKVLLLKITIFVTRAPWEQRLKIMLKSFQEVKDVVSILIKDIPRNTWSFQRWHVFRKTWTNKCFQPNNELWRPSKLFTCHRM